MRSRFHPDPKNLAEWTLPERAAEPVDDATSTAGVELGKMLFFVPLL